MALTHLLYLHGFRSSPQSFKAQRLKRWVQANRPNWHCSWPALPPSPAQAFALITQTVRDWPQTMAVVGSSLGGFYAACLAAQRGCASVLLNPAAHPARDLSQHLGLQTHWHAPNLSFEFTPSHVDELRALTPETRILARHAKPLLLVAATGDELLDWQEMVTAYGHDQVHLIQGSDHGLSDFDSHLPVITTFLLHL